MEKRKIKGAFVKSARAMYRSLPIILGVIILVSIANTIIPKSFFTFLFQKNVFLDSFVGGLVGSILAGTPITSYVLGGELLKQGVSLVAVTAFLVSWVTVGIVQLPAEIALLGKKFAITRNITAFILAILVAIVTVLILTIL
jgi:uncharacterized membrane protein YraQ (UPF0718 family)